MVSLPSKWTKAVNLKKGDEIDIEESNGNLVISKEARGVKKQTTVNLSGYIESSIRVAITNAYRNGYDKILVRFEDEKQYKILKEILQSHIIGFDVTKKEKDSCVIENITEPSEEQFDVILRKILYNISLLIKITEDRLRNKAQTDDYREVVMKIHQYDNFCRRVISKKGLGNQSHLLWSFLALIVHAQKEIYHLNEFLDTAGIRFRNFEYFENLKKIFALLNEGYVKKDRASLEKIYELVRKVIYKDFYELIQKNQKENIALYHITVAIRNFYLSTSPLIGLLLESNTSK